MNSSLSPNSGLKPMIEPLEQRIAPATLLGNQFTTAVGGSDIKLEAAGNNDGLLPGLSTGAGDPVFGGGQYLLFVVKGSAIVHTTDLNHNNQIDFNEITGISAGPGLQMLVFTDIHGDIVTNLNSDFTLTDSDNNASNGRDGRVLLNSTIEKIEMRSLTAADLPAPDVNHPNVLSDRLALSNYSIFGNIYAGGGFGTANGGGLVIDTSGSALQAAKYTGTTGLAKFVQITPEIGSIRVGTAASGQFFSFGVTGASTDVRGQIVPFVPPANTNGADIIGVGAADPSMKFNLDTLQAGDGGFNGRGGNVVNVAITGDVVGGYKLIAGNGGAGSGPVGPAGGSIINYSDQGSVTSQVLLQTGNGGTGLVGKGGPAGVLNFDPTKPQNINGHVVINMGNGGDGFTAGAAGGSLQTGNIKVPEGGLPVPSEVVSTTRFIGDIGNERAFDFNGTEDVTKYSDAVYSTTTPGQLAVVFGNGTGFDPHKTIFLNGPANATVTVADFNGDGHPDIAAASGDAAGGGISVFLSQYDATGHFTGFTDAQRSPIPSLNAAGYLQEPVPITKLAAGDFNGDGTVDLAFLSNQELPNGDIFQVITLMSGATDAAHPNGSGFFFADFASGTPFGTLVKDTANPVLKPTALHQGDTKDVLLVGFEESKNFTELTYTGGFFGTPVSLGSVDTNRKLNTATANNVTPEEVTLQDFTILDLNGDNNADVVALSKTPEGFLVTFQGSGTGTFTIGSNQAGGDNSGIKISGPTDPNAANHGLGLDKTKFVGILSVNADNDPSGAVNDVAIIDYRTASPGPHVQEVHFVSSTPPNPPTNADMFYNAALVNSYEYGRTTPGDASVRPFDVYVPNYDVATNGGQISPVGYALGTPYKSGTNLVQVVGDGGLFGGLTLSDNGFLITAGDGGNSLNGAGGAGGVIGNGALSSSTLTAGFNILLPSNQAYAGTLRLIGGNGGQGFTNGGAGGSLSGISITYNNAGVLTSTSFLFAGHGGDGLTGTGGAGGDLSRLHVQTTDIFAAGDGGTGVFGGRGGFVIGSNIAGVTDTTITAQTSDTDFKDVSGNPGGIQPNSETSTLVVHGGDGGFGTKRGGTGGGILGFAPVFLPLVGGEGGLLHYTAGNGGDSVGGIGGTGGSIVNSSPLANTNNLVGDIFIKAGQGGDGVTGGRGGGVSNFINSSSTSNPLSLSVLGGNGGTGTGGSGGAGGSISNVIATSRGQGFLYTYDLSKAGTTINLLDLQTSKIAINYNRIIAGQGGDGLGGNGGAGGSVSNVTSSATSTAAGFATVAGKGGTGLLNGAAGGSLNHVALNAGSAGKILFVAGDGGNTTSLSPLRRGGRGGDILDARQIGAQDVNVDLIAGNGGSTLNFGSPADLHPTVGAGGSIIGVNVSGNIGNIDPTVAIRSYNNTFNGERMSDFVANTLLASSPGALTDAVGNVGLVAGAAGRVQFNQATSFAPNGFVSNVRASNIMSMVAGSVDSIASIQKLSSIIVTTTGGVFGADKTVDSLGRTTDGHGNAYHTGSGQPNDYLHPPAANSALTDYVYAATPTIGDKLVDGAIVAKQYVAPVPASTREFTL